MASVLKSHAIGMTDKVTLEKVELLLNTVLKELQKEKLRSRQLEEQVRKLTADQKPLSDAREESQRQQQEQADELMRRIAALESTSTGAVAPSSQPPAAPTAAATAAPSAATLQQLEELRRKMTALEAQVGSGRAARAPAGLRHRESPAVPARASGAASGAAPAPKSEVADATASLRAQLEGRIEAFERRTTAELQRDRERTNQSLEVIAARVSGGGASEVWTSKGARAELAALDSRLMQRIEDSCNAHARQQDESSRRTAAVMASSVAAQAQRLQEVEAGLAQWEGSAKAQAAELVERLGLLEASETERAAREAVRAADGAERADGAPATGARSPQRAEGAMRTPEETEATRERAEAAHARLDTLEARLRAWEGQSQSDRRAIAEVDTAVAQSRRELESHLAGLDLAGLRSQLTSVESGARRQREESERASASAASAAAAASQAVEAAAAAAAEAAAASAAAAAAAAREGDARPGGRGADHSTDEDARRSVAALSVRCDETEGRLARLSQLMAVERGTPVRCIGRAELDEALRAKLGREELAQLRDAWALRSHPPSGHGLSHPPPPQQRPPPPPPPLPPPPPPPQRHAYHAWSQRDAPEADAMAPAAPAAPAQSSKEDGGESLARSGVMHRTESRRAVEARYDLLGEDGRLYRGAGTQFVSVPPPCRHEADSIPSATTAAPAIAARPARPSSAGTSLGRSSSRHVAVERPGSASAKMRAARPYTSTAAVNMPVSTAFVRRLAVNGTDAHA